jgi:predicted DNA-binding protein (UPF0251 family)
MKWVRIGLAVAGAVLAGGAVTFAVLTSGGAAQAQGPGDETTASRFQELLAQQLGISVDQLQTAATNAKNQLADELLAQGKITQQQHDRITSASLGGIFGALAKRFDVRAGVRAGAFVDAAKVTADVSHVDVATVRSELEQGKSLAQIAEEHGVSRDALKAAITNALNQQLKAAVSSGKITQATADQVAQRFTNNLDALIDHTGVPGHHGRRGMQGMPGMTN